MEAEIIYFSATGTTRKIVKAFTEGLNCNVRFTDITRMKNREKAVQITGDLVVIAVPVYGERIPEFIYEYLRHIKGNGKPLVGISVYGNVGYGISTAQFSRFAKDTGLKLIGVGMFIGEHTYASESCKVALGRPDEKDLVIAKEFGERIKAKLDRGAPEIINIPTPLQHRINLKAHDSMIRAIIKQPTVDREICNKCGACAALCPVSAISSQTLEIDERKCLRCYACVKNCPKKARRAEFRVKLCGTLFEAIGRRRKENITII